ncbi:Uridine nucleosidase 1 [Tulasnella sp. 403]|nr:Uridine nucleosidase 1 [Tulasnella sp. 403]
MSAKPIWLDSDPDQFSSAYQGHDDAIAILLACTLPEVKLLGLSTVHGNTDSRCTQYNGVRLLEFFAASKDIDVWPGANHPLIRPTRADPEIHGPEGLAGAEGLPERTDDGVARRLKRSESLKAIHGIAKAVTETRDQGNGRKVTVIATGPLTNIALFFSVYPDLIEGVEEIVFMGGGRGLGNRSAVAEFNILCDPEAAQIVLDVPVRKVMVPLNTTHTAILTLERHCRLLNPDVIWDGTTLPEAITPLRHTLSSLLQFFTKSYRSVFRFDGPPLHDPLTVAYVIRPDLFQTKRYRVDCELNGLHTAGEIPAVFDLIFSAITLCDQKRSQ